MAKCGVADQCFKEGKILIAENHYVHILTTDLHILEMIWLVLEKILHGN